MIGEINMDKQTTIFLTPLQATQFLEFQKNHAMFVLMQQYGVFDIRYGNAKLNFANGILETIEKNEVVYHK